MYSSAGFQLVSQASLALFYLNIFLHLIKKKIRKKELSVCQSLLCLDLVSFPVLSQIKLSHVSLSRLTESSFFILWVVVHGRS